MPKYVSRYGTDRPNGTHLYPASSIKLGRSAASCDECDGEATAPAYCGNGGMGEHVFAPDDPEETLRGFDGPRKSRWDDACPECKRIVRDRLFTDPEWLERFHRDYSTREVPNA